MWDRPASSSVAAGSRCRNSSVIAPNLLQAASMYASRVTCTGGAPGRHAFLPAAR